MKSGRILTGILCLLVLSRFSVSAQEPAVKKIDDSRLISLYESLLRNPDDSFLLKRIEDEREEIRNAIEAELTVLVAVPADEEVIDDSGELSRALDRQRNLIAALQERVRERRIDLDLLAAEEDRFYVQPSGTGAVAQFKTTTSYPHLLARKAVLEERIAVLQILIPHQNERLSRLILEQRKQQFGSIINIATYLLILLFIWLIEKLIRRFLLTTIPNRSLRYTVIKIFTGGVYTATALWLFAVIYAKNPNILASFAIIGAGIAIALQDVIKDVVGWFIIYQSDLYSQGDRICIGTQTGEVVDIGLLHTKVLEVGIPPEGVLEQTGKILTIPNGRVLQSSITNYNTTSDFMKAEMSICITFESDWQKAEEILHEILLSVTEEFAERDRMQHHLRTRAMFIPYKPSSALVYKDIAADGVQFILRFTVPVGQRRGIVSTLTQHVLERFNAEPDVNLAYTTNRILAEVQQ